MDIRSIQYGRHWMFAAALGALLATSAVAQGHSAEEVKEDISRHRAMAKAHDEAAKCLEAGKGEQACYAQLQKDCKGLAIGKTCGMRHVHKH